ncbi:nuclear transport factor 2 family protein [Mesorhizobium sp. M0622]|uniref:nuclear transport factor 2 family protein n=1 Tax=unclassified Mesorhizobium TaxID=325217 RepID=UPI003335620C
MTDLNSEQTRNLETVRKFFDLMHRKDIEAWGNLWADRILVFYPPAGFGTSIDGKVAILAAFRRLFDNFESFDPQLTAIYPAADSDAIVVGHKNRAVLIGGTEYTNSNIAAFRFEKSPINAYHDYFDPRRFQVVVDALAKA